MKDAPASDMPAPGAEHMRVMFVLPRMVAGGVERATLNLIDGLQQRSVACHLALGRCRGELLEEARALTTVEQIAPSKWLLLFGMLRVLRSYRPTHIVTAFADVSMLVLAACRLVGCRAPVVVGVHGTLLEAAAIGGWRIRWRYALNAMLAKRVYRRCAALVAVSQGVSEDIKAHHAAVAGRVHVIHNPVLSTQALQRIAALPARSARRAPFRLVALGRLAYEKGFDVLVRAMPLIVSTHDVHLDIYGEGIERQRLQRLIDNAGMRERIRLQGNTLDPWAAIHSADVFVFPSRNEGFGVALVEALACGSQIVASDCPHGPAEILERGRLGQLVPPEDPAALASAICRSLSGEVIFDTGALRDKASQFTVDTAVEAYLALLKTLDPGVRRGDER